MRRSGFVAVEALVVGAAVLLCVQSSWTAVAHQMRAVRVLQETGDRLESARTGVALLRREVRAGTPGDGTVRDGELHLRAFRAAGVVCGGGSGRTAAVEDLGTRLPNPAKDSVLLLDVLGYWHQADVVAVRRGRCGSGGGSVSRVTLDTPWDGIALALFFERGAYRFSNRTLRYTSGRGGWQPLLRETLDDRRSVFRVGSSGGVRAEMVWEGIAGTGPTPPPLLQDLSLYPGRR